ncbi:MAG: alanine--tRNA ligase [Candidatus Bathyarchaeota archaeon]|nr:MAG: alanine--tRNA ligase [Candidatus Bathyarchaeota archaeon]
MLIIRINLRSYIYNDLVRISLSHLKEEEETDSRELRKKYLLFFRQKGHKIIPSASLILEDDPTVLFTTAGMHPLKPYLLGTPHPQGKRIANVQKCMRTSDIDQIGDTTHLTFFEMLGNWSLGDYFKKESIEWSYEFLTGPDWLNINPEKLNITVFQGDSEAPRDDEAAEIWHNLGIPEKRIHYLPREDNWWGPVEETGPCGPCTEIFYDVGKIPCSQNCRPGCSCGKYFEIWNNVFMTYNQNADGSYTPLKQHNVDTGMGIERTVPVLTGQSSVYEIHTIASLMHQIERLANIDTEPTEKQISAMRIIADHIRATTFIMSDDKNIQPANKEHGYIVRRLIRRAIRQGRVLNIQGNFLHKLAEHVIDTYQDIYPELRRNREFVLQGLSKEEGAFNKTLKIGLKKLNQLLTQNGVITGKDAFVLFTSFGFPIEMIKEITEEQGFEVNLAEFEKEFERHRQLSRVTAKRRFVSGLADHTEQSIKLHTTTHLLHQALRDILGNHIQQKGSNITQKRARFDINLDRRMTPEELNKVEQIVNEKIACAMPVKQEIMTVDAAREAGAINLFHDKYGDTIHVFSIGDYSKEICSGPHVQNTKQIGKVRIQRQRKIGANTLRIYAEIDDKAN